jgi:ubiquinone/menaquinone biosynthesis C-methylase UbiE
MARELRLASRSSPRKGSVVERIQMTRQEAEAIEHDILIRRHIERYAIIRQFAYGRTVDCACGVGYGTHLLAKNSDIIRIYGIDSDPACIAHARKEFSSDRIEFIQGDIASTTIPDIDFLASLETIEHLLDPSCLNDFARRCGVREIMISFPAKKTTHYNCYHYWDFTLQDVLEIFGNDYVMINNFTYTFDTQFVHLARLNRECAPPRRFRACRK